MSGYAQAVGETTADWLRRLISMQAPADVRADVRALLEFETRQIPSPGNHIFPNEFLFCERNDC